MTTHTYAPDHITRARTEIVTKDNVNYGDLIVVTSLPGDLDTVRIGERYRVEGVNRGWITLVHETYDRRTFGWVEGETSKVRTGHFYGIARRCTDGGQWLESRFEATVTFTLALPGAQGWLIIDPADVSDTDRNAFYAYRDALARAGAAVEWQGADALTGRVYVVAAAAHVVPAVVDMIGWFRDKGATIERLSECATFSTHSRRVGECRFCGRPASAHGAVPAARPVDVNGDALHSGQTVERAVTVEGGSGPAGERGVVLFAGAPYGNYVVVAWESTNGGAPFRAYPNHVRVVTREELRTEAAEAAWALATGPIGDPLWDVDAERPAAVIVFDDGSTRVVNAANATQYARENGAAWARPLPAGYVVPADCDAARVVLANAERAREAASAERAAAMAADTRPAICVKPVGPFGPEGPTGADMCGAIATHVGYRKGDGWVSDTTWCQPHVAADTDSALSLFTWAPIADVNPSPTWCREVRTPAPYVPAALPAAPLVHTADSGEAAYTLSQTSTDVRDGDILHVPSASLVAVMVGAWPCAVTIADDGANFHRHLWGVDPVTDTRYVDRFAVAMAYAEAQGYPVAETREAPGPAGWDRVEPGAEQLPAADAAPAQG